MSTRELYNLIEHFDRRFDRIEQLLEQLQASKSYVNADGAPPQQPVPDEPFMHKRGWGCF